MYPGHWASVKPDDAAVVMASTGEVVTHAELDAGSNRLAHLLRSYGLRRGDHIALLMENHPRYFEVVWAALRSGVYVTLINWHLTADEAAYIIEDSDAHVLISTEQCLDIARRVDTPRLDHRLLVGDAEPPAGWDDYESAIAAMPDHPIDDESAGEALLYSSGTTGRPKGVLKPLPETPLWRLPPEQAGAALPNPYGFDEHTVYLSPAPLYHAAPIAFCRRVHVQGGAVVVMDRFDPTAALEHIERYRITHSQWVPTMFVRLLDLPEETRLGHDLSSHRVAIHAAAPCPVEVKQRMMDWWGPIIHEYYAGSEGIGNTRIGPEEWLANPGSVGLATPGVVFVLDEDDEVVAPGESGLIHFDPIASFEYKGDPDKTAGARSKQGYFTYGDVGYIDANGYLHLTDRKSFMIISGGVNIYPREAEDVLIGHPAVLDVGVFGIPHPDLGEEVKAAVELQPGYEPSEDLAVDLLTYCREHLSGFKCPRSIDFAEALPRLPTGKLRKADLRAPYWT